MAACQPTWTVWKLSADSQAGRRWKLFFYSLCQRRTVTFYSFSQSVMLLFFPFKPSNTDYDFQNSVVIDVTHYYLSLIHCNDIVCMTDMKWVRSIHRIIPSSFLLCFPPTVFHLMFLPVLRISFLSSSHLCSSFTEPDCGRKQKLAEIHQALIRLKLIYHLQSACLSTLTLYSSLNGVSVRKAYKFKPF